MEFDRFIKHWVVFCSSLDQKGLNKVAKGKLKGKAFEDIFHKILKDNINAQYNIIPQKQIMGFRYIFDFVIIDKKTKEALTMDPKKVVAVIEVKSHGFYGYKEIDKLKSQIIELKNQNPKLTFMYITYRETNTYDKEIQWRLGTLATHYYRLTDSGDGVQLQPRRVFPETWDRMIGDIQKIAI